jgi:AraC family transcriptional regulator, transcriptional activator of pobA
MAKGSTSRRIPAYFLYGEAPRPAGPLLHVETIEARSSRHHWKIEPHLHQVLHQVIFVLQGRGVTLADGVRAQYRPPALIVIPAGTVHGFEFEPGTSGHVISISAELQRELVQQEPGIAALFARPLTLELERKALRATDLARSVRMLGREHTRLDCGHRLALQGWLQVLIGNALRLAQHLPNPADPETGQRRALVTRFGDLVEKRFRSSQSVAEYAAALHVSQSRLRNTCLALAGQSPIQLIHARILLEAKRRLHYTDGPVREIAYALGFDDPAYFTRFFTRRVGLSPRAFRRRGPEMAPTVPVPKP